MRRSRNASTPSPASSGPDGADTPRVAVLHEWMAPVGGSEQVARAILSTFPGSHLWTIAGGDAEEPGTIVRSPLWGRRLRATADRRVLVTVANVAWRHGSFRPQDYDLVISSHHAQAHTAATGEVPHISYVHSPARYAWLPGVDERANSLLGRTIARRIRRADLLAAATVDDYAANSATTAERIRSLWGRDARVIHPPVALDSWPPRHEPAPDGYLLSVSRFIGYKRLDLTIELADRLGIPAVLAGSGPDEARLRERAAETSVPVSVRGHVSHGEMVELLHGARALVFPGIEDFGLVPVEAMACGVPVVAYSEGGATETVQPGVGGVLVASYDPEEWGAAVDTARWFDPATVRASVERFDIAAFRRRIAGWAGEWLG